MCTGIALPMSDLPADLHPEVERTGRLYVRAGRLREAQFHWWQDPPVLPVRYDGRLRLLAWGSKRRGRLPQGGWVPEADVGDLFGGGRPEPAVVPVVFAFHAGAWYAVDEGVRAVVVRGPAGPVAYLLTRPASKYYRNMAGQADAMPVFVNQVI